MITGHPSVTAMRYPTKSGKTASYPRNAVEGRQWEPPLAPHMRVDDPKQPHFDCVCLMCKATKANKHMLTGSLCKPCAATESKQEDPFGIKDFWLTQTEPKTNYTVDELLLYRWYGWHTAGYDGAVAPLWVFNAFTEMYNAIFGLGLTTATGRNSTVYYIGRMFVHADMELAEAKAAGLVPLDPVIELEGLND